MEGAPLDTLKQSIADQSGFWSDVNGFEVLFGRPQGSLGTPFSDPARSGPPERRKNAENVVSEAPRMHVRVLFGTWPGPKGVFLMKT